MKNFTPFLIIVYCFSGVFAQLNADFLSQNNCDNSINFTPDNLTYSTYVFDFGDGAIDTISPGTISHQFASADTFLVTLSVYNGGQTSSVSKTVYTSNISFFSTTIPTESCNNNCIGAISVSVYGGIGPYTFEVNSVAASSNGYILDLDSLCAGNYDISITDQLNCSRLVNNSVTSSSVVMNLNTYVDYGNPCTVGSCGAILNVNVSGGTPPFEYSIDGGNSFQSNSQFVGLCAGYYNINVLDSNGCLIEINENIHATPDILQTNVFISSNNTCNGIDPLYRRIYATTSGGSGSFSYLWNTGNTSQSIWFPNYGQEYIVTVTDTNGCTATDSLFYDSLDCYTISGHVYLDIDSNCVYDSLIDFPLSCHVDLATSANGSSLGYGRYTNSNGFYQISVEQGTYFINLSGYYSNILNRICPNVNYSVTVDSTNQSAVVDVFLTSDSLFQDLTISLTRPLASLIGCTKEVKKLRVCNQGTTPMSGTATWYYSDSLKNPSQYPINSPYIQLNNIDTTNRIITYDILGLPPSQCSSSYFSNFVSFDYLPNLSLGSVLTDSAFVNPVIGDVNPQNNATIRNWIYCASYDPNFKEVAPEGDITVNDNDHDYIVHFQNEGNGNAELVIIRDTLDVDLDINSLRNIDASHDFVLTIEEDSILVFSFYNIQLPPKNEEEYESRGWVSFTLTQNGEKPVGTNIENTAAIYFDFNEPVITNTVINTIVEKVTALSDIEVLEAVSVYPNPSPGIFTVAFENKVDVQSIRVYNIVGKEVVYVNNIHLNETHLNLQNETSGVYFLEIVSSKGKAVFKIIKE